MQHKDAFFQAEKITAAYGKKQVLREISFALQPHTLTGLLGANGCGKTTLLKCIINQLPHEGSCKLEGKHLETESTRALARKLSYIPQRSGLQLSLPVLDVVLMGFNPRLKLLEHPSQEQVQRAREALQAVGLAEQAETDYLCLSEGQKQLVFLARTLIEDTALLLLDEPDSALDLPHRYGILRQLRALVQKERRAGLLSLHDPVLALTFCDQLLLLRDGCCWGVIHPKEDDLETMERQLQEIYGKISLVRCEDRKGNSHLTVLWEELE